MNRARSALRPLTLAAIFLIFLVRPILAELPGLPVPATATLENGLQILVIEDHRAPVVTHMVWYRVGAADEPTGSSGIAHFLEHLMFKGTDELGPGEFTSIVEQLGGRHNAGTSQDYTVYFQRVAREHLSRVMQLEADRMTDLRLLEEDVVHERDVVLEERRMRTDNSPDARFSEQLAAAQYLSHPYGSPVIGWQHEIEQLSRADAFAFYRQYYAPNNAVLIVAGDVTLAEVEPLAVTWFGELQSSELPDRVRPLEPPQIASRRLEMSHEEVATPSWRRTYLAPSTRTAGSDVTIPLQVLAEILGGGVTSRLYRTLVVDEGVAAAAGISYNDFAYDMTSFVVYGVPVNGTDVGELEEGIERILESVLTDGVTEAELELAKATMIADVVYAQDSQMGLANLYGTALVSGIEIEEILEWPAMVEAVNIEQVNAAAHRVLVPARSVTGILLPAAQSQE